MIPRTHSKRCAKILKEVQVKNNLEQLQENFVMVPIDKADNNFSFVCKRYYVEIITKELGLEDGNNNTYEYLPNSNIDDTVKKHEDDLAKDFNISVPKDMRTLPDIYWLPKLHKTPIKARFIIASRKCSLKKLSKDVTSIFKLAYDQVERYNQKASIFSGIKSFWVIQNSLPVLNTLDKINLKNKAKTLSSFDFSTLYTNIPHVKLFKELSEIIKFIFKGGRNSTISVGKHGKACWSRNSYKANYDIDKITNAVKYLLDNCHFKFGNKLFRQIVGIPMGSDPAPFFANLFLYQYESRWLNKMKKENYILVRKFGRVFRFIDDLLAVNDGNEFERYHQQIYPPELVLKKENVTNSATNFLELNIQIKNDWFHTMLYDKRDDFGFHISRLPYKDSNIPNRMFYSSISAETLRICRATSNIQDATISAIL